MNWNRIRQPIRVSCDTALNDENYIFYHQAKQFDALCAALTKEKQRVSNFHCRPRSSGANAALHQVISVVGERGSGKSSFIQTATSILEKNSFYTIGPLNPNTFGNRINIMELILAKMQQQLTETLGEDYTDANKSRLYTQLKKAIHALNQIRRDEKDYLEDTIAAEVLNDYCTMSSFPTLFEEIVRLFLQCINEVKPSQHYQCLSILIDDVDLIQNQQVYTMLEDISKFLSTSVVVVLAYRATQLQNALVDAFAQENETLLRHNVISCEEIALQATRYLEKLLPLSTQILLPNEATLYHTKISIILREVMSGTAFKDDTTSTLEQAYLEDALLEDWLYTALLATLRLYLKPIDQKEKTAQQFPSNLRGILELIKLLWDDLTEPQLSSAPTRDEFIEQYCAISKNIRLYRDYLHGYTLKTTSVAHSHILKEWELSPTENKNFILYLNLYRTFFTDAKNARADHLIIEKTQPHNVALADVYTLLEDLKGLPAPASASHHLPAQNNINLHFVYCTKVFYSLALLETYLKGVLDTITKTEQADDHFNNMHQTPTSHAFYPYLSLLNGYVVPSYTQDVLNQQYPGKYAFTFTYDKSDFAFDAVYQKLISKLSFSNMASGGDVQKGARPLNQDKDKQQSLVQRAYQYRSYFHLNGLDLGYDTSRTDGYTYSYDLFGFLCTMPNALDSLSLEARRPYVLLSFFDIDRFVYANYTRRSEEDPLGYFASSINNLMTGEDNTLGGTRILNPLPLYQPLSKLEALQKSKLPYYYPYAPAYSAEEVELLPTLDSPIAQKIASDASIHALKETIGTKPTLLLETLEHLSATINETNKQDVIGIAKLLLACTDKPGYLTDDLISFIIDLDRPRVQATLARKNALRTFIDRYFSEVYRTQYEE